MVEPEWHRIIRILEDDRVALLNFRADIERRRYLRGLLQTYGSKAAARLADYMRGRGEFDRVHGKRGQGQRLTRLPDHVCLLMDKAKQTLSSYPELVEKACYIIEVEYKTGWKKAAKAGKKDPVTDAIVTLMQRWKGCEGDASHDANKVARNRAWRTVNRAVSRIPF